MSGIIEYMTGEHRRCDAVFAEAENAAAAKDWKKASDKCAEFSKDLDRHLRMEEEILFPAFEAATGMTQGPTQVMRMEHAQMRKALDELDRAVNSQDVDAYAGESETLHILMQQHNMKEEQVLYPMAEQHLSGESGDLIRRMQAI